MAYLTKAQKKQNEIAHQNIARIGHIAREYRQRWINKGRPVNFQKSLSVAKRYNQIFKEQ